MAGIVGGFSIPAFHPAPALPGIKFPYTFGTWLVRNN